MKEMIKKYRGSLICSVLVMLIGVLVGFTSTQSMWANVFFVVTDCALVAIIFYDNRNRQQSRKIIGMTMWIIPIKHYSIMVLQDWSIWVQIWKICLWQ